MKMLKPDEWTMYKGKTRSLLDSIDSATYALYIERMTDDMMVPREFKNMTIEFRNVDTITTEMDACSMLSGVTHDVKVSCRDFIVYDGENYTVCRKDRLKSSAIGVGSIKNVIFSGPVTTVIWNDGTKTHVRCENEDFDKEKGLAMCIAKKALGNKGRYYDIFKEWIKEDEEIECPFTKCKWYNHPDYRRCNECKKNHKEGLTKKR